MQHVDAAGARTARDVLDAGVRGLEHMGMDRCSAEHAHAAARRLADDIEATLSVRVDPIAPGPHTVALLVALQVLLAAGPKARQTARTGEELAGELERALTGAEPASGYLSMLRAGRERRESARSAVTELRSLMAIAEEEELVARFAQTSVDLLRAPDDRNLGLSRTSRLRKPHQPVLRAAGGGLGLNSRRSVMKVATWSVELSAPAVPEIRRQMRPGASAGQRVHQRREHGPFGTRRGSATVWASGE